MMAIMRRIHISRLKKKKLKPSCFYINQIYLTPNKGNHYMAKVADVQDNSVQASVHIPKIFCRFLHR